MKHAAIWGSFIWFFVLPPLLAMLPWRATDTTEQLTSSAFDAMPPFWAAPMFLAASAGVHWATRAAKNAVRRGWLKVAARAVKPNAVVDLDDLIDHDKGTFMGVPALKDVFPDDASTCRCHEYLE